MKLISIIIVVVLAVSVHCQNNFDPKIIVLLPKSVKIDRGLEKQIKFYEKYRVEINKKYLVEKKDSLLDVISTNDSIPDNLKEHFKNQIDFAKFLNFKNQIAQNYAGSFLSFLASDFENPLVVVDTIVSFDNIDSMKYYSKINAADYLINILEFKVSKYEKNDLHIKPQFSVYDYSADKIQNIERDFSSNLNHSYITVEDTTLNLFFDDIDELTFITNFIKKRGLSEERDIDNKQINTLLYLINSGKNNKKIEQIFEKAAYEFPTEKLYTTIESSSGNDFLAIFVNVVYQQNT